MGAGTDFLNLLSSSVRLCLENIVAQASAFVILSALRRRRRSLLPMICFTWAKSIVMLILMDLRIWYGDTETLLLINGVVGVCGTFFSIWIAMYTYEGDFAVILFSMVGAELMAEAILQTNVLMTNLFEGRAERMIFRAPFQWADIQMLLWGALILAVISLFLFPVLQKCREFEVRQEKAVNVIKAVWIVYTVVAQFQGLTDFRTGTIFVLFKYMMTLAVLAASLISVYLIVRKDQSSVRRQREFLLLQKERMERYYLGMQMQIREMEQNQQKMERRMEEAMSWKKEQSVLYLQELRSEYDKIRGGMYCNDRLTDAVLSCQKEAAESMGITVEYALSGYSRGEIREEEISRILFYLLDYGIRENEKQKAKGRKLLALKAGTVKNCLILELYIGCPSDTSFPKKMFREFIEKYNGTITEGREGHGRRIVISLQSGQRSVAFFMDFQARN